MEDRETRIQVAAAELTWWRQLAERDEVIMDLPRFKRTNGRKRYAHVTASSMLALEAFAFAHFKRIEQKSTRPHFDAPEDLVPELEHMGVRVRPSAEVARRCRELGSRWPEERKSRGYKWGPLQVGESY